jgi:Zn-dependent M28 family amino/carboxypeptidase
LTVNEAGAARLLEGTGQDASELVALAARHAPLPRFAIPSRLQAHLAFTSTPVSADNVAGIRRGTDPDAAAEYVVLSAHLDHIGVGEPVDGDRIFNGAMDNAAGIATLLEAARHTAERPSRRSLVFVAVTAEEQGLLGSRYFAWNPTVPRGAIVADVNVDMFLPLYPMRSVIGYGAEESDLGTDLRRAAASAGVSVMADPEPARRSFIRSDQYSFIRGGIPSLALKLGYELGSPEHEIVTAWRAKRYHAPSDDLAQPIDRGAVAAFNALYLSLVDAIANRPSRPSWNDTSFFKRFAKTNSQM